MYGRVRRGGPANVAGARPGYPAAAHDGSAADFVTRVRAEGARAAAVGGSAGEQFLAGLVDAAADTRTLLEAGRAVVADGGPAVGSDGVSPSDLDHAALVALARGLSRSARSGAYRPGPVRRVSIPKPGGRGDRVLSVPTVADRILQTALLTVLQPYLDPLLPDTVIGGRPRRSPRYAIRLLARLARGGAGLVAADVRKAFDVVPRGRLMDVLRARLRDGRLVALLGAIVDAEKGRKGIAQGSPLSPLLLNLYLDHSLDRVWRRRHPETPLLRYIDDILLVCPDPAEAPALAADLANLAESAGTPLKVVTTAGGKPARYQVADTTKGERVEWLGFDIGIDPDGRVDARIAAKAWEGLEDGLVGAHHRPNSALHAKAVLSSWVGNLTPCRPSINGAFYARLGEVLKGSGFGEASDRGEVEWQLEEGHSRLQPLPTPIRADADTGPKPERVEPPTRNEGSLTPGCQTTAPPVDV